MLKAAQEAKPDLVNWPRPKLAVKRKTEFERCVKDWEYLQGSVESVRSVGSVEDQAAKPLQDKQVAL